MPETLVKSRFPAKSRVFKDGVKRVRVLLSAPDNDNPNPVPIGDGFGFLVYLYFKNKSGDIVSDTAAFVIKVQPNNELLYVYTKKMMGQADIQK